MKKKNFWEKLKKRNKPIYILAPMAGITDSAFRQMCKEYGADVVYSEMASATALVYNPKETLEMLRFDKKERPYVVQLFGSNPEHFAVAATLITKKIKPDGIDINFGCPVKKVNKQGAGAALMADLNLAKKVVAAVIKNTSLPVSIKCRSAVSAGGKEITALDLIKKLQGLDIKAIMIHGRHARQAHAGEVNLAMIKKARKIYNGILIGNGGIKDEMTAKAMLATGADGVAIGQGSLGKPWTFKQFSISNFQFSIKDIYKIALKHARLVYKLKGKQGIIEMRKHLCWYVTGLPNASELRRELVQAEKLKDVQRILKSGK